MPPLLQLSSWGHKKHITGKTKFAYQDVLLRKYGPSELKFPSLYREYMVTITDSMNARFTNVLSSPIFKHLVAILNVRAWPSDENDIGSFGDIVISNLSQHFNQLMKNAR